MAGKMPDQPATSENSQGNAPSGQSQQAFAQLSAACERTLYRVSRTVLHSDEDCARAVQEALGKARLRFDASDELSDFRTEMIRILLGVCRQQLKHGKNPASAHDKAGQPGFGLVSEGVLALRNALQALPADQRIIVELACVEELKTKEIARILRMPAGAVRRRLVRAQSELAACLPPGEGLTDLDEKLKETVPPTPIQFSQSIALAMSPQQGNPSRRRFPLLAVAAVALSIILLVAAVANFSPEAIANLMNPPSASAKAPAATATADPNGNNTISLIETGVYPTPPPATALPTLPVQELNKAPASADGWQAAAYTDGATWYYNPADGKLARTAAGKSQAYTLTLGKGQSIDAYSFIPSQDGRWLAFTVNTETGDDVWLVTDDGRKMSLLTDTRWVDMNTFQPISFSFANMKAFPFRGYEMSAEDISSQPVNTPITSVCLCLTAPDREVYYASIFLSTSDQYAACALNDRRGLLMHYRTLKQGETMVNWKERRNSTVAILSKSGSSTYTIGYSDAQASPIKLRSGNFSLIKTFSMGITGINSSLSSILVIYQDDKARTLWELNEQTGKEQKIAQGCLAAGWLDDGQYWYCTQKDTAAIVKSAAAKFIEVMISGTLSISIYENSSTVALEPIVSVTNSTDDKVLLDDKTAYDFTVSKDGKQLWHRAETLTAQNPQNIYVYNPESGTENNSSGFPIVIPSGSAAQITFSETVPYSGKGTYTFSGTFNGKSFSYQQVIGQSRYTPQQGVSLSATITASGRLGLTYGNTSFQSYRLQVYNTENIANALYQPRISYRLLSGDKEVKKGIVTFNKTKTVLVPAGGTLTLLESSGDLQFADLPAGQYRLQAAFVQNDNDTADFSEFSGGETIDVSLTIPGK